MSYTDDLILNSIKKSRDGIEGEPDALMKAMNKAGLVQKEVQVRGKNGQIFTRKQWVKASEDQPAGNQTKTQDNDSGKSDRATLERKLEYVKSNIKMYEKGKKDAKGASSTWYTSKLLELNNQRREIEKQLRTLPQSQEQPKSDSKNNSSNHFTGKSKDELWSNLKSAGYEVDSADKHSPQDTVTLYKDKKEFTATFNKYSDGGVEVLNIKSKDSSSNGAKDSSKESNKPDSNVASFTTPSSKQDLVKLLQSGVSREDIMAQAEKDGITWKKSDHAGVNWMRCSMAITGTTTKGNKKEDATQQKKPENEVNKSNSEESATKSNSSVIGKDYHSLTTDEEAKTPAGEAHNMMVGALKSRGMLPKTGQIKPDSKPINTIAKELRRRQISSAIKATQKSEETRALQVAKELDKIAGYSSPYGLDDIEVVLKNCLTEDSSTQEERVSALAKLMGKDYVPYSSEAVRTSADTIDGTVSVGIVPKRGGYFDATFTYADGSSRSETYDSISAVKTASDKFVKSEVDFVERMNKSTMSEIEKGNTYSFAKMFAKKYPDETAEIGLDPQNNYRALINYSEEDKIFTVYRKNGDKDFFDNKMNYLGRKLY